MTGNKGQNRNTKKRNAGRSHIGRSNTGRRNAGKKNSAQKSGGRQRSGGRRYRMASMRRKMIAAVAIVAAAVCIGGMVRQLRVSPDTDVSGTYQWPQEGVTADPPDIDVQLLTVNEYSRPGVELSKIKGIVVHYTANPGATAQENRDYFEGLKDSHKTKASSNFIVGLNGEIIQCVPTWEEAYASNERNADTISIECCHPDETGVFTDATYWSLVKLCAFLCGKYDLNQKDIIRHYDVTGKICPKFFVDNEDAWKEFKGNVKRVLREN